MEEVREQADFFEAFEQWLKRKHPEFGARLESPEPFTEAERVAFEEYNHEYLEEKKTQASVIPASVSLSSFAAFDSFSDFLRSRNADVGNLSLEAIAALNKLFNLAQGYEKEGLVYADSFEKFTIDGKEYFFPNAYFRKGFTSANVFVATQTLLAGSQNPEVKLWKQNQGKCVSPQFDSTNPYADVVRDVTGSLTIVVETTQESKIVYKTVSVVEDNNNNDNNLDNSDAAKRKREIDKNRKLMNTIYQAIEPYGVNKKTFEKAVSAYSQAMLYRVLAVMSAVLPKGEFQMRDCEKMVSRLVFCLNGDIYLDLHGAECDISLPNIPDRNGMPLSRPIQIGAVFRFPFSEQQNAFMHPFIICDALYSHFLATSSYELKAPAGETSKNKLPTVQQEEAAIEKVDATLMAKQKEVLGSKTVGKIRRPVKHTKKIVGGVAAGTFFLSLGAGLAFIPGGQIPGALSALLGVTVNILAAAGIAAAGSAIFSTIMGALAYFGIKVNQSVNKQNFSAATLQHFVSFESTDPRQVAQSFYAMVTGDDASDVEGFLRSFEQDDPLSVIGTIDSEEEGRPKSPVAGFFYHRAVSEITPVDSAEEDDDDFAQEKTEGWVVVAQPDKKLDSPRNK